MSRNRQSSEVSVAFDGLPVPRQTLPCWSRVCQSLVFAPIEKPVGFTPPPLRSRQTYRVSRLWCADHRGILSPREAKVPKRRRCETDAEPFSDSRARLCRAYISRIVETDRHVDCPCRRGCAGKEGEHHRRGGRGTRKPDHRGPDWRRTRRRDGWQLDGQDLT